MVEKYLRPQWWGSGPQSEEGDPIPEWNPRCVMASKDSAETWENSKHRGSRVGQVPGDEGGALLKGCSEVSLHCQVLRLPLTYP